MGSWAPARRPVDDVDGRAVLDGGFARAQRSRRGRVARRCGPPRDRARSSARAPSTQPAKTRAERGDVGVGAVGAPRGRSRGARDSASSEWLVKRERPAREDQRVDVVRRCGSGAPARAISALEERHVPRRGVRDEDRAVEDAQRPSSASSANVGASASGGRVDPVDVRVAAASRASARAHERCRARHRSRRRAPLDADLDDAILRRVEPGHLEIDERERRLGERKVPRRPGGGGARRLTSPLDEHRDALADADAERRHAALRARAPSSRGASVPRMRQPLEPIGCPSAIAPPLTLTRAGSSSSPRMHAIDCAAKASFSSTRSRSLDASSPRARAPSCRRGSALRP